MVEDVGAEELTMLALTLLVLSASPLGDATAQQYGRTGFMFRGKDFIATVSNDDGLEALRDSIPELTFTEADVTFDSTTWKGAFKKLETKLPKEEDDAVRIVGCFEPEGGKRCAAVIPYLATTKNEVLIDESQPTLGFAGVKVKAPSGCDAVPPSRISCDGAELVWSTNSSQAEKEKSLTSFFRDQKAEVTKTAVKCTVGGVATSCTKLTVTSKTKLFVLLATVKKTFAMCTWSDGEVPPACATVFSLR
ncbi:MAG: hypothetical protein ACO1OB_18010 [Archangium sp.]